MKLGLMVNTPELVQRLEHALEPLHDIHWVAQDETQALRLCRDTPLSYYCCNWAPPIEWPSRNVS